MKQKEFINGLFVKKGKTEPFIEVGVKKQDFIKHIESIQADEKGFFNLTMAPQKNDPNKYSVWVNDWKPSKNEVSKKPTSESYDGDLPF
jgi:hypothetical protein